MTAIRPVRCPHGTCLIAGTVPARYEDGCRIDNRGLGLFRCASEPNRVFITLHEYLRDWAKALEDERRRARNFEAEHARALELNEFFDMGRAMKAQSEASISGGRGSGLDRLAAKYAAEHVIEEMYTEHAEHLGEVPWSDRVDD
jgi:hypothetical protein